MHLKYIPANMCLSACEWVEVVDRNEDGPLALLSC